MRPCLPAVPTVNSDSESPPASDRPRLPLLDQHAPIVKLRDARDS